MRKKRKGSEASPSPEVSSNFISCELGSLNVKSHYSLEDYARIKKRCKEDAVAEPAGSFMSRLAGVATAPPCGASSLVPPGRGLKRKIGCIDVITRAGRKNKIVDDYIKGETIGRGKFGSVWLCRSKSTGVEFACKTLQKGEETVQKEVEIMQHLSGHPGIVTLQAVYEESDCFHLVMELCSGGRLIDQMTEGQLSEQRAANIFKDVVLVIKYCHDMGVVHRDIKPENILLTTSGNIKLADFGLAMRISNGQTLSGLAGSPAYIAPEVLLGNYSAKVDIWSAGVLLHALLAGFLPFKGDSKEALFDAIKHVQLDFHTGIWESVSKPARDLISRMLTRDVSARITADEVLRHPWILFYTERTLKTVSVKSKSKNQLSRPFQQLVSPVSESNIIRSKSKNQVSRPFQQIVSPGSEPNITRLHSGSTPHGQALRPLLTSDNYSCRSEEENESDLVDVLAVAISRVRISEPKRSRLCSPVREPQYSVNLTANSLCRAF